MRPSPRHVWLVILVFATPFLLGSGKCEGHGDLGLLWKILDAINEELDELSGQVYELMEDVDDLDERVSDLEACGCDGVLEPVCGDDGNTYVNACEADCSDVEIEASGECPLPVCGGDTGQSCQDGDFCELPEGCDDSQVGICEGKPEVCTTELVPVCGCDANTYLNDCLRQSAGVSVDHVGACPDVPVTCTDNDACGKGEFCRTEAGVCDSEGICIPQPIRCDTASNPVCGCNDRTYGNVCEAAASGVSIAHKGVCEPSKNVCGGLEDIECDESFTCQYDKGVCGMGLAEGICVKAPLECSDKPDPVCGCDENTYDNACIALSKGVSVSHEGVCEPVKP